MPKPKKDKQTQNNAESSAAEETGIPAAEGTEREGNYFADMADAAQQDDDVMPDPPAELDLQGENAPTDSEPEGEVAPPQESAPSETEEAQQGEDESSPPVEEPPQTQEPAQDLTPEQYQEQQKQAYETWRTALVDAQLQRLSPDVFIEEQRQALAEILADNYIQGYQQSVNTVAQYAAPVIQQTVSGITAQQEAEKKFYSRWPGLAEYKADVRQSAIELSKIHGENSSVEDMIQRVGAHVCILRELDPSEMGGQSKSNSSSAQASQLAAPTPQVTGNTPLSASVPPPAPKPTNSGPQNPFDALTAAVENDADFVDGVF